jgi:uncharacterized membrane protein YcaP (DUF421 family)
MKKEAIDLSDWYRILHGNVPLEFYLELVIRALFVYLVLTFGMKYLGKRQSSQLSRSELAATATLAAATGLIILAPDRGLLPPVIIVLIIIGIQRFVHHRSMKSQRFEFTVEGHLTLLVEEGIMNLRAMKQARITKEQLFLELRGMKILHLGKIKRLYLEANGDFTTIEQLSAKPGLPTIPAWDQELIQEMADEEYQACDKCGRLRSDEKRCPQCGNDHFVTALHS